MWPTKVKMTFGWGYAASYERGLPVIRNLKELRPGETGELMAEFHRWDDIPCGRFRGTAGDLARERFRGTGAEDSVAGALVDGQRARS
ncbi:hypothetical protein FrEUN1fDRAFT_2212 [Parafrankia sp. EUN1f]|nr:hypothetical protein FrEUN1fDRAFT_2212 [Parafrankia sp. EUN1f]